LGVATHVYVNGPPWPEPPGPSLELLVRNLDLDTVRSKRLMDRLLEQDGTEFARNAATVLKNDCESRGARYLLGLLAARGLLAPVLCDPGFTLEQALGLARAASGVAPNTDLLLARGLTESLDVADDPGFLACAARVLEILAEISDVSRVFPALVRLLRHPNPHLRSKTVLTLGRVRRSAQWVRQRLGDEDSRIRANALESLWDVDTEDARELLQSLVQDPNNRVAGNAILGLYRLGDVATIPEILRLAGHGSAQFRSTAAWLIGETEDPRFAESLLEMLRDTDATVRRRAFWAFSRLRTAAAKAAQVAPCRMAARLRVPSAGCEEEKDKKRLLLAVTGHNGWTSPILLPTQLVLSEDGKTVTHYRVSEKPLAEALPVVFLLPASNARWAREAALACLPWKRPCDLWACDFYRQDVAHEAGGNDYFPHFEANADLIQSAFARMPLRFQPRDIWRAIRRWVHPENASIPENQQLMIIGPVQSRGTASEELVDAVRTARAFVQVIASGRDPALEDFCKKVGGLFRMADQADQSAAVAEAYIQQLARYEVSYQPVNAGTRTLKIRLHGPSVRGETEVRLEG